MLLIKEFWKQNNKDPQEYSALPSLNTLHLKYIPKENIYFNL